jgi:hypothetical protein
MIERDRSRSASGDLTTRGGSPDGGMDHDGHHWMMIVCCIPMIVVVGALVAVGAASPGWILVAVSCVAMMALMMRGMGRMDGH